jgi:predicted transcriptional regulator
MTPAAARHGLEPGLRAIATTSPDRLRVDLRRLAERSAAPRWSRPLADGDQYLLRQLTSGIRRYHKRAIGPFWTAIRRQVDADLARRSPAYLTTGFGGLVARLHPEMCWRSPTLEVGIGRIEADVELSGRGLRIIPSYFCWQHPIVLRDSRLRPVLVYPIAQSPLSAAETPDLAAGLTALMGRTRTAVLQTVARGACSTTTLAERAGISRASASEHARVLHQAGLIITRRNGLAVEHTITPTGLSLLGAP